MFFDRAGHTLFRVLFDHHDRSSPAIAPMEQSSRSALDVPQFRIPRQGALAGSEYDDEGGIKEMVADRVGFEPTVELPPRRFSRP